MLPRNALTRVALSFILCYITLIFIYIALPSPQSVDGGWNSYHHQEVLRAGKVLTSTYRDTHVYNNSISSSDTRREWFAIEWQLFGNATDNSIVLHIGTEAHVNLTRLASVATLPEDLSQVDLITFTAKAGDQDGLTMPWFDPADACLLNWERTHDKTVIQARAFLVGPGTIQIWPENRRWHNETFEFPDAWDELKPFLTIEGVPLTGDPSNLTSIEIDDMTWYIPTRTFPIRRFIVRLLRPVTMTITTSIIFTIFQLLDLAIKVAIVCVVVSAVSWLGAGQPPFRRWAQSFLMLKWLYASPKTRIIWGPGGMIEVIDENDEERHKRRAQRRDPQPLTCVMDFFTSASPMDDFLITFESLHWLLRPLGESATTSNVSTEEKLTSRSEDVNKRKR